MTKLATETTSIASQLGAVVSDDGMCIELPDGSLLEDRLQELAAGVSYRDGRGSTGPVRYEFADGSSIVVHGPAWDYGIAGCRCYCWAGTGHSEDCQRASVIAHSLYEDGVDLDGCETSADVLRAVMRQRPESLGEPVLGGDAGYTLGEELADHPGLRF